MAQTNSKEKYNHSALIAQQFGFEVRKELEVSNEAIKLGKAAKKDARYFDDYLPSIEELSEVLIQYKDFEKENGPIPLSIYFDRPATGNHTKHRKRPGEEMITFHILGVDGAIAESILIKTISVILNESGHRKNSLQINNVGGKESKTLFNREATSFFRKHINLLSPDCRQLFKSGVHRIITDGGDQCKILKEHAPESMDFLNEETRDTFTKLIERVETFELPYEIKSDVLGDANYSNYTQFRFVDEDEKVVAVASRYNNLSKKIGLRKEIPAICANVWIKTPKTITQIALNKASKSPNFILQLGEQAKTFTLKVLQELWNHKIYAKHSLMKDRLSPQIQESKREKAKNIIIIGHKEAMDMNVMIRDAEGRSQKILTVEGLVEFLKEN